MRNIKQEKKYKEKKKKRNGNEKSQTGKRPFWKFLGLVSSSLGLC